MEPMNLGSPGSPSPGGNHGGAAGNFLPSFLMGDTNIPTTPRSNTLSPTRGRTQLAFGNSPRSSAAQSPPPQSGGDFNRSMSMLQQRSSLFAGGQQQHHHQQQQHYQSSQQLNASISGPPTMGLFDSLKAADSNATRTGSSKPAQSQAQAQGVAGASSTANFSFNQSYAAGGFNESSINDASYLTQSDFNASRLMTSPHYHHLQQPQQHHHQQQLPHGPPDADFLRTPTTALSPQQQQQQRQATAPFWVTVFGFQPASVNAILSHFAQCGTIVDKVLPPGGGNWMHLKYASRVDCDKAVNFNERVIGGCMMIGVVHCRDADIVDKENNADGQQQQQQRSGGGSHGNIPVNRVRPLAQSVYHNSLSPNEAVLSPTMPKRSTGLVNKAMDMLFGW